MSETAVDRAIDELLESWAKGARTLKSIEERLADDVVAVDWLLPGRTLTKEDLMRDFYAPMARSVPDMHFDVFETVREGNRLVVRAFFNGTFTVDYEVYEQTLKATNQPVRWEARDMYRFNEDKIDRIWFANDTMTVLRELNAPATDVRLAS